MTTERVQNCQGRTLTNPKHHALKVFAAGGRRAVKITVTALHQRRDWVSAVGRRTAKRVKRGEGSCRIDLKDGALMVCAADRCRTVEIAVVALYQPGNRNSTLAKKAVKRVEHRNGTGRVHSKYCSLEERTAGGGRAIEVTVSALHQPGDWDGAVCGKTAKRVERGQAPCRIDLEHRPLSVRPAQRRCAVEITIAALH